MTQKLAGIALAIYLLFLVITWVFPGITSGLEGISPGVYALGVAIGIVILLVVLYHKGKTSKLFGAFFDLFVWGALGIVIGTGTWYFYEKHQQPETYSVLVPAKGDGPSRVFPKRYPDKGECLAWFTTPPKGFFDWMDPVKEEPPPLSSIQTQVRLTRTKEWVWKENLRGRKFYEVRAYGLTDKEVRLYYQFRKTGEC